MTHFIVGVMGPGECARPEEEQSAYELGRLIAQAGWVLLSGGRNVGVMDAVSRGAKTAGGLTIGVLPAGDRRNISVAVDIPICTGMGSARNNINVLSSDIIVACGMGPGTASEVALALKAGKQAILLRAPAESIRFFRSLAPDYVSVVTTAEEVIEVIRKGF